MDIKTLVIDDIRTFDSSYLPGREFTHVRNSRDGIKALKTGAYASLLLDYDLIFENDNPEDTGARVARWLRRGLEEIPTLKEVLIITTLKEQGEDMLDWVKAAYVEVDASISDLGKQWNRRNGRGD